MGRPTTIVLASGNAGKIRELMRLLEPLGIDVVAQSEFGVDDAIEDGETFAENAIIKAEHAARATGMPAIADDSGLTVNALDGAPGIYSARYAGTHGDDAANNQKLLRELDGVDDRSAAFVCTACYVEPGGEPILAEGEWRGEILHAPRGAGGFGYDPLFLVPGTGLSSAQLPSQEKNAMSHRGQALRKLVELIEKLDR